MTSAAKPLRVGRTVVIMTAFTFLGQILALGRESVVAAKFGAGALTDAFLLAILVPNAVLLLVQNGLLMAFIPIVAETVANRSEDQIQQVVSNLINCVMLMVLVLGLMIVVSADTTVTLLAPTLTPDMHALTVRMFQLLTLITLFSGAATLLTGVLNVYRVYVITALFGLILNGIIIAGIILLANDLSIYALVLATIGGYALQMLLLAVSIRSVHKHQLVFDFKDPMLRKMLRLAWPAVLTLVLQQVIVFADRAIAVQLGVGNVAALNFASKITLFLPPLLVGAVSSIVLPELARETARGNWDRAKGMAMSILRYMFFVAVPIGALLFILRRPIIVLVFERGAFTGAATDLTEGPMGFYTITLVALCLRELIVRFFYAAHDTVTPLLSGGLRTILNLGLDIVLARSMGVSGIALASAIAICADVLVMMIILSKKWQLAVRLTFPAKIAMATAALCIISSFVYQVVGGLQLTVIWLIYTFSILISAASGGLVYWVTCALLDVSESRVIIATGVARIKAVRLRILGGA